ncbi:MAG: hypothetical protein NTY37_11270 [Methanothrix sp.]|nr:hypothetical protein [Methanothrix sp.]
MKFQIAGAIFVAVVILVGFSVASNSGYTTIEGNIQDVFDLTVDLSHVQLSLIPGDNVVSGNLIVNANGPWKVEVKSDHPEGKMSEWNSVDGYLRNHPWAHKELIDPMHVLAASYDRILTDQDQTIFPTNYNYGNNMQWPIQFKQRVELSDQRIGPTNVYRIVVTFTGSMAY